MPPRQPLKAPSASRSPRRGGRKPGTAMAANALAEVAASLLVPQPTPAQRRGGSSLSPYPDLTMAIHMLEISMKSAKAERAELLTKWIATLTKLQTEMQALHKLEILKARLNSGVAQAPVN